MILLYFLENLSIQNNLHVYITLSKVFKLGFFFWSIFSRIRTEQETLYLSVFIPNTGKYRSEKTLYLDTFYAVYEQTTPNIRFSIEDQKIGSLPILDIKTGKICQKCVRKRKIQSCVYTSFTRFIPLEHKIGFCTSVLLLSFPFQIFSKLQMELGKPEKNIFRKMVTHKNLYINAFLSF